MCSLLISIPGAAHLGFYGVCEPRIKAALKSGTSGVGTIPPPTCDDPSHPQGPFPLAMTLAQQSSLVTWVGRGSGWCLTLSGGHSLTGCVVTLAQSADSHLSS